MGATVAALAAGGSLAGCTAGSTATPPGPSQVRKPSADEVARRAAAAAESDLATLAAAIGTAFATKTSAAALVARTRSAAGAHTAHATALLQGLPAVPAASPSSSGAATGTASPTGSPSGAPTVPAKASAAAAALVLAQTGAARAHLAAMGTVSGVAARLLASVAASDLAFASTLRPLTAGAGR